MREWLEEFRAVFDTSPRVRATILGAIFVPPLIPVFGAILLDCLTPTGPSGVFTAAVNRAVLYLCIALALLALITCVKVARAEYRRAHKQLVR